jgi:hypothetical protein
MDHLPLSERPILCPEISLEQVVSILPDGPYAAGAHQRGLRASTTGLVRLDVHLGSELVLDWRADSLG